jgi:hypothetical protein
MVKKTFRKPLGQFSLWYHTCYLLDSFRLIQPMDQLVWYPERSGLVITDNLVRDTFASRVGLRTPPIFEARRWTNWAHWKQFHFIFGILVWDILRFPVQFQYFDGNPILLELICQSGCQFEFAVSGNGTGRSYSYLVRIGDWELPDTERERFIQR